MTKYKKGSFSVTPNKEHLRGKKAAYQSVYFWICDHADDDGICYPARQKIAKEAGVDIKTVDKYIPQMMKDGLLVKTNRTKKGSKEKDSNLYQIMILDEYKVPPKTEVGTPENGATRTPENGAVTVPNVTQPNNTETSSEPFDWETTKTKMMEKEGSILDIIATFLDEKKLVPEDGKQLTGYIKRYSKVAKEIQPFVGKKFSKFWQAVDLCKEESHRLNYGWTLDTVYKKITKI